MYIPYDGTWKCPCCKSPIVEGKSEKYQTLDEHVSNPNSPSPSRPTLVCSNSECISQKSDIFWDFHGDRYGGYDLKDSDFINQNDAPFGSLSRRLNVEIYKKGLKSKKYLSPAWCLWYYQPILEHEYKADEQGKVLRHWIKIGFLKKDDRFGKNYCIVVIPFWRTWKFLYSRFKRNIKSYRETNTLLR